MTLRKSGLVAAVLVAVSFGLGSPVAMAAGKPTKLASAPAPKKKLYDRLGGKEAIKSVVDEFVANCGADKRINSFFGGLAKDPAKMTAFKKKLVDQVCQATGGPCKYTGKTMKETHKGMGVTTAHFNAVVEDLTKVLDKLKVPAPEKKELLAALGPMKKDIVEGK